MQTAVGALKLLLCCGDVPVKSISALRFWRIDPDRHRDLRAVVEQQGELAVLKPGDDAAHRLLGVVLHMAHVGQHHVQAEMPDHLAQFLHAFFIGGNLRLQIGHVLLRIADGYSPLFSSASISASRSTPRSTSRKLLICTPSSSMRVENGGIEPGVMPPMSAWWPRVPT